MPGIARFLTLTVALLVLPGCATLSTEQLEARDYRNFDYVDQFKYDRKKCQARGGRIIVNATGKVGRDGIPRHREKYFCA